MVKSRIYKNKNGDIKLYNFCQANFLSQILKQFKVQSEITKKIIPALLKNLKILKRFKCI